MFIKGVDARLQIRDPGAGQPDQGEQVPRDILEESRRSQEGDDDHGGGAGGANDVPIHPANRR